jgi:regulator of sigma E protease
VRNNQRIVRSVTETEVIAAMAGGGLGLQPSGMKVELGDIVSYGPADKAGLKTGDVILAADSTPVLALTQLQQYIRSHAGQTVTLHVERADTVLPVSVTVGKDSVIQVALSVRYAGTTIHTDYSIPQAAAMAVEEVAGTVALIWTSVSHIITGTVSAKQSIGGPIKIARMASRSQDAGLDVFARFLALISISLAVMNLLPLPGLDGGHLMFVGIEAIIRREIPTKVKIRVQQAGLLLLLVLMAYVFYLDLS